MASPLTVHQVAEYEIRVQGRLRPEWSGWFGGLTVAFVDRSSQAPVTIIAGWVKDQSELHGQLAKIRDLNLPLLLVLCRSTLQERPGKGQPNYAEPT